MLSLRLEDEGVWNCVIESDADDGEAQTKFIFVNIGGREGPEILLKESTVVEALEGEETSRSAPQA